MSERVTAILKVDDLTESLLWYRSVGFAVRGTAPDEEPTWAEVGRDGMVLQLITGETPWGGTPRLTGSLYVHPSSVKQVLAEVQAKVTCEWGIEERPWGAIELTLRDPNGYFITFTEGSGLGG